MCTLKQDNCGTVNDSAALRLMMIHSTPSGLINFVIKIQLIFIPNNRAKPAKTIIVFLSAKRHIHIGTVQFIQHI